MLNKIVNCFLIIFFLIIFIAFIFFYNYEGSSNYYVKISDENIALVSPLVEYFEIVDIKEAKSIKLTKFTSEPNKYYAELYYESTDNSNKNSKETIDSNTIRQNKNFLKNTLNYIKTNGMQLDNSLIYELLINENNISQVSYLISYFKLDNIQSLKKVELSTDYTITMYYNTAAQENEQTLKHHFEQDEINEDNPILDSISYIEEYGNTESKQPTFNISITTIYIIICIIIVVIIYIVLLIIKYIFNKNLSK